jgi:predicted NBD/HSP70 family sugar kinase
MSRADLARETGLTRAAISLIVEEFIADGILYELPPQAGGRGRNGIPVTLQNNRYYALGVRLSRSGCSVGIVDFSGELLEYERVSAENGISQLMEYLAEMCSRYNTSQILGVGVSAPGPIDVSEGKILNPPRFEKWHELEIVKLLSNKLGIPAYLEHDASAMARYQESLGDSHNFLFLLIDGGVGGGIVSEGRLLGGSRNFVGEIGHTSIRFDGRLCECGNRGCLETYASIPALLEHTEFANWKELIDQLDTNKQAQELLDQEVKYLSAGIVNLLNLISLDTIYVAGEITYKFDILSKMLSQELETRPIRKCDQPVKILEAKWGEQEEILAAANMVFERFLTTTYDE